MKYILMVFFAVQAYSVGAHALLGWQEVEHSQSGNIVTRTTVRQDPYDSEKFNVRHQVEDRNTCFLSWFRSCPPYKRTTYSGRYTGQQLDTETLSMRTRPDGPTKAIAVPRAAMVAARDRATNHSFPQKVEDKVLRTNAKVQRKLYEVQKPCELSVMDFSKVEAIMKRSHPGAFETTNAGYSMSDKDRRTLRRIAAANENCVFLQSELKGKRLEDIDSVRLDDVYLVTCHWNGPQVTFADSFLEKAINKKICTGDISCDLTPRRGPARHAVGKKVKATRIAYANVTCASYVGGDCTMNAKSCLEKNDHIKFSGPLADSPTSDRFLGGQRNSAQ